MEDKETVFFDSMTGVPNPVTIRRDYTQIHDLSNIPIDSVGKTIVIVYLYPEKLFGNYHKDVLYYGTICPSIDMRKYLCLKDVRRPYKIVRLSFQRMIPSRYEFYLKN